MPTVPVFTVKDKKKFDREKEKLIKYLQQTKELGENTSMERNPIILGG